MKLLKLTISAQAKPNSYDAEQPSYYGDLLTKFHQFMIPADSRILYIGCKNGAGIHALKPSYALGLDIDEEALENARLRYPQYNFYSYSTYLADHPTFDYIIISQILEDIDDLQELLEKLKSMCTDQTRVIINWYRPWWKPVLGIFQKIGLSRCAKAKHWLSQTDANDLLQLAGFERITYGRDILLPLYIPFLSWFLNNLVVRLPLINYLCLQHWIVARPLRQSVMDNQKVSVIIPCRNEKGNIETAVQRVPVLGSGTEIIFIEGHSTDGTLDELKRIVNYYPEKNIKFYTQQGVGKGDAVRLGFSKAQGDILMIQDADLTVAPEELTKFYNALVAHKGEFINGSRLVYGMESQAMRFLNLIANYFFGFFVSWIIGQKVKDTLCGTKVVSKQHYDKIARDRSFFGNADPFGDFDLLFGAAKQQLKIIDMPVRYKNRNYGSTQISRFYHGFLLLKMSLIACSRFKFRQK